MKTFAWYKYKVPTATDLNSAMLTYYKSKSGLASGTVNDHEMKMLGNFGYTGTLNDRRVAFYRAKTGNQSRDLDFIEGLFHSNNTYDYV